VSPPQYQAAGNEQLDRRWTLAEAWREGEESIAAL